MISADVSCRLLEVDFSGVENILTGYYLHHHGIDSKGGHDYIQWSRLGLHAQVTAIRVGNPASLDWPQDQILSHLAAIKEKHGGDYDVCKRVDHGTAYGLTPYGMTEQFPDYFKSVSEAQYAQSFLFNLAPGLPTWHTAMRKQGREVGYLGGPTPPGRQPTMWDHPFGYRHWFWDVLSYKPTDEVTARKWLSSRVWKDRIVNLHGRWFKIVWGGDSKRVVAFYPQSTGAGMLKRCQMLLFAYPDLPTYIGDCYFGRTPLLQPVHDSLFLHVPNRCFDRVAEIVVNTMQSPVEQLPIPAEWGWGDHLRVGVEAKSGLDWSKQSMKKIKTPGLTFGDAAKPLPMPDHGQFLTHDDESEEEWDQLQRIVA